MYSQIKLFYKDNIINFEGLPEEIKECVRANKTEYKYSKHNNGIIFTFRNDTNGSFYSHLLYMLTKRFSFKVATKQHYYISVETKRNSTFVLGNSKTIIEVAPEYGQEYTVKVGGFQANTFSEIERKAQERFDYLRDPSIILTVRHSTEKSDLE